MRFFARGVTIVEASGKVKVDEFTAEIDITGWVLVEFPDTDGDGANNIKEILAGKDPLNERDCPSPHVWYIDQDGDEYGNPSSSVQSCSTSSGYVSNNRR